MQFHISKDEFIKIVEALRQRRATDELQGTIEVLKTDEEKIKEVVDFLQTFMIDIENEAILGFYNYDLVVDREIIMLDSEDSDKDLKELVKTVWVCRKTS